MISVYSGSITIKKSMHVSQSDTVLIKPDEASRSQIKHKFNIHVLTACIPEYVHVLVALYHT